MWDFLHEQYGRKGLSTRNARLQHKRWRKARFSEAAVLLLLYRPRGLWLDRKTLDSRASKQIRCKPLRKNYTNYDDIIKELRYNPEFNTLSVKKPCNALISLHYRFSFHSYFRVLFPVFVPLRIFFILFLGSIWKSVLNSNASCKQSVSSVLV